MTPQRFRQLVATFSGVQEWKIVYNPAANQVYIRIYEAAEDFDPIQLQDALAPLMPPTCACIVTLKSFDEVPYSVNMTDYELQQRLCALRDD